MKLQGVACAKPCYRILSGLAGVARSHLAMIENGSKNANVETLWRIAGGLGIRLSDLLRRVEDEIERRA